MHINISRRGFFRFLLGWQRQRSLLQVAVLEIFELGQTAALLAPFGTSNARRVCPVASSQSPKFVFAAKPDKKFPLKSSACECASDAD